VGHGNRDLTMKPISAVLYTPDGSREPSVVADIEPAGAWGWNAVLARDWLIRLKLV